MSAHSPIVEGVTAVGAAAWRVPESVGAAVRVLAEYLGAAGRLYGRRYGAGAVRLTRALTLAQVWFTGVQALQIVLGAGVLGAVAMMGLGYGNLRAFGAEDRFGDLLRIAILGEMGPLLTALVVVARSGTAITTELASMRVNHEIDALTAHGVDALAYLSVPRVVGVTVANVALTVLLCAMVYLGCFVIAALLGIPLAELFRVATRAVSFGDLTRGVLKAVVFGLAISTITVHAGISMRRDMNEIPRASSRAVVRAILAIFVLDALVGVASLG